MLTTTTKQLYAAADLLKTEEEAGFHITNPQISTLGFVPTLLYHKSQTPTDKGDEIRIPWMDDQWQLSRATIGEPA